MISCLIVLFRLLVLVLCLFEVLCLTGLFAGGCLVLRIVVDLLFAMNVYCGGCYCGCFAVSWLLLYLWFGFGSDFRCGFSFGGLGGRCGDLVIVRCDLLCCWLGLLA